MKRPLFLAVLTLLFNKCVFAQDINSTGEDEWTINQEQEIETTSFLEKNFPNLPKKSKDLSYLMPPAGRQGRQGSCWAWATTYAYRSSMDNPGIINYFLKADGSLDSNKVYSPAYTYQFYKGNKDNCSFGNYSAKVLDNILKDGVVPLGLVSYDDKRCNFSIKEDWSAASGKYKMLGYNVFYLNDLYSAKKVLSDGIPLIISIKLNDKFHKIKDIKYEGKPIYWNEFGRKGGDHAMVCVGYDDSLKSIKVLNSWGSEWAMDGYCYISYDIVEQLVNYFAYPYKKNVDTKLTTTEKNQTEASGSSSISEPLSTWLKEGYSKRLSNYKIALAELNSKKNFAIIEIRSIDYKLIKSFYIENKTTKNFYINGEKYSFTLDDIAKKETPRKWFNMFAKVAYFTFQELQ